jgi:plastocyanin
MPRTWIVRVLASTALTLTACAPSAATSPTTAPRVTAVAAPSPVASPAPSAVPIAQPSVSPAAAAGPEVNIVEPPFRQPQEWTYAPTEVSVKVGSTVVWNNTGAVAHTVTADDGQAFDSGTIDPKARFMFKPQAAGAFAYHCTFHPWMKATLVVTS